MVAQGVYAVARMGTSDITDANTGAAQDQENLALRTNPGSPNAARCRRTTRIYGIMPLTNPAANVRIS